MTYEYCTTNKPYLYTFTEVHIAMHCNESQWIVIEWHVACVSNCALNREHFANTRPSVNGTLQADEPWQSHSSFTGVEGQDSLALCDDDSSVVFHTDRGGKSGSLREKDHQGGTTG